MAQRIFRSLGTFLTVVLLGVLAVPVFAQEVTIHYLTVQQENEGWPKILKVLTEEYAAQYPNIKIKWKYEYVPQPDLMQRVQLLAAVDNLPLLFNYESGAPLLDLIKANKVLEIESTFKNLGIYQELNPGIVSVLKELVMNAGLYALPLEMNIEGFWYNKKIFADQGFGEPQTWEELTTIAEKLHQNGIQPFAVSGIQRWPITRLINGYVVRKYGTDVMSRVMRGELKVTDPGFVEAARIVYDWGTKGYFGPGVNTLDYGPAQDLFLQGKAAIYYMGSWALRDFHNPEVNKIGVETIGLFNVPLVPDGVGTLEEWNVNAGLTTSVSRAKFEENSKVIGGWMQYVFSRYGDRAMQELGLVTGFHVREVPKELSPLTKMVLEKLASVKGGSFWFEALFDPRTTSVAWDNAQLLAIGAMTPEEYLEELQKAIDEQRAR
ncbi:MAG: extracellular solute-binding protein [Candidatus Caldatribacterium sp.]|nr:extracellular solute-binding protein [Candidatus Caldatribacterium sp.]